MNEESIRRSAIELKENTEHKVEEKYQAQAIATRSMNPGQLVAFKHMVAANGLAVVSGQAGSGKSYTLAAVREAYEAQGYKVQGLALSGIAAEGLQNSSGIESTTIHKKLWQWNQGRSQLSAGTVLVVDEAGMVGTRQMAEIIEQVRQAGAKLIVTGDEQQLQAIEAGAALRLIKDSVGAVSIDEVVRQKIDWQRQATQLLSGDQKQIEKAIDLYQAHGSVRASQTLDDAKKLILSDWSKDFKVERKWLGLFTRIERKSNLILAHRNADVDDLNQAARQVLKHKGYLGKVEHTIQTAKGKLGLCVNDRVMFLRNEASIGVKNGSIGTVKAVDKGILSVELDNGRQVAVDAKFYKDIAHGYAATVHKAQGATVDCTYVLATRGFDKHLGYVALSRHRQDVNLYYSKDSEGFEGPWHLKTALSRSREKDLATDYDDIKNALYQLTYHDSTFGLRELQRYLKEHETDHYSFSADQILRHPDLVILQDHRYTTKQIIETESRLISALTELKGRAEHAVNDKLVQRVIEARSLTDGQFAALNHMLSAENMVVVTGKAGTGKSYILGAVREAYEAQGYSVRGMALSGIAAEGLQRSSGIASSTIHQELHRWSSGYGMPDKRTVLVLDEAGMVGTRQMTEIVEQVRKSGAKLIVTGDDQQLQAIEAGAAFRLIKQRLGAVGIEDVIRQSIDWQRQATRLLSGNAGQIGAAIDAYRSHGHVRAYGSCEDARQAIVADWSKDYRDGKSRLILAHRNEDVFELNRMARSVLKQSGVLGTDGIQIKAKWGAIDVAVNDRLIFLANDKSLGVKNGSLATVKKIDRIKGRIALELDDRCIVLDTGKSFELNYGYAATVHKSQGTTTDHCYVLATSGFDKHLAYVALSRHRLDVSVYCAEFEGLNHLKEVFSRPRGKDLAHDYPSVSKHNIIVRVINGPSKGKVYEKEITVDRALSKEERQQVLEYQGTQLRATVAIKERIGIADLNTKLKVTSKEIKQETKEQQKTLQKDRGLGL